MMEMLDLALPPDAQVFHKAMRAWLRGGVLNSLKRPREAEKVNRSRGQCMISALYIPCRSCDQCMMSSLYICRVTMQCMMSS